MVQSRLSKMENTASLVWPIDTIVGSGCCQPHCRLPFGALELEGALWEEDREDMVPKDPKVQASMRVTWRQLEVPLGSQPILP